MLTTTQISGFLTNRRGQPSIGLIRFTPSRLWVVENRKYYACLAPTAYLDRGGRFTAQVTATDNDAIIWHYLVETPAGEFRVYVPGDRTEYSLKELIDGHRVGARTS